jgi:tetratricopeptide (TPR) repeat protein
MLERAVSRSRRTALALAVLAVACAGGAVAAPDAPWRRYGPAVAAVDSARVHHDYRGMLRTLDSLEAAARGNGNRALLEVTLARRMMAELDRYRPTAVESLAVLVWPLALAEHDTLSLCRAIRYRAVVAELNGRHREARRGYERLLVLASRARLWGEVGWAHIGRGYDESEHGRFTTALGHYRRAVRAQARGDDARGMSWARAGLARVLQNLGERDAARREYEEVLAQVARTGDLLTQADAWLNLGALEFEQGDPGHALDHYQQALSFYHQMGRASREATLLTNMAMVAGYQDDLERADSLLQLAGRAARTAGDGVAWSNALAMQAALDRARGRPLDAENHCRRALALSESLATFALENAYGGLCEALADQGRWADVLALVDSVRARQGVRLTPGQAANLEIRRVVALRRLRRTREAEAAMRPLVDALDAGRLPGEVDRVQACTLWALCLLDAGERAPSQAWMRRSLAARDARSARTGDAAWREHLELGERDLATEYIVRSLGDAPDGVPDAPAAAAFELLEQLRVRALRARADTTRTPPGPRDVVPLETLRRQVLRPGEAWLELLVTPEGSLAIACTRERQLAVRLPAGTDAIGRLARLRDLAALDGADSRAWVDRASADLGAELLGPLADLLSPATTVLVSAGGVAEYPVGLLRLPGHAQPLAAERVVAYVPAAAMLARARSRRAPSGAATLAVLARSQDDRHEEIAGAAREARWLARSFAGSTLWLDVPRATAAMALRIAAGADVIHFATHARSLPRSGAQDGLLVGVADGAGRWLDAQAITRSRPRAQLCVLSSCRTVRGGRAYLDAMSGLGTAWLLAGVPAVIATQWAVDDAAMVGLVQDFYAELAAGRPVGEALRRAQARARDRLLPGAAERGAGVVVLGDPAVRVNLRRR